MDPMGHTREEPSLIMGFGGLQVGYYEFEECRTVQNPRDWTSRAVHNQENVKVVHLFPNPPLFPVRLLSIHPSLRSPFGKESRDWRSGPRCDVVGRQPEKGTVQPI